MAAPHQLKTPSADINAGNLRQQLAMEAAELGIYDVDLIHGVAYACPRVRRWFALGKDEPAPNLEEWLKQMTPAEAEAGRVALTRSMQAGGDGVLDFQHHIRVGAEERVLGVRGRILFDNEHRPLRLVGVYGDMTELTRAKESAQRADDFKKQLFDCAPDCVLLLDLESRVLSINTYGQHILETASRDTLCGSIWLDWWRGDDQPHAQTAFTDTKAGHISRFVGRYATQTGTMKWWSVALTPLFDAYGQPEQVLVPMRDITHERMQKEEAERRAVFAQRLLGIVSHDLRNPIGSVLLSCEALHRRQDLNERQLKTVGRIVTSAERANRLIFDLLDFTQTELGGGIRVTLQRVSVDDVLKSVIGEVRAAHPHRSIEFESRGGDADVDPDRIAQVLTNLLTNALQYSADDSTVRVLSYATKKSNVLEVHNTGEPVDPRLIPTLFDPLKRGKDAAKRSGSIGLGLFIVREIVAAHGGVVRMESAEGHGTRFIVTWPTVGPVLKEQG